MIKAHEIKQESSEDCENRISSRLNEDITKCLKVIEDEIHNPWEYNLKYIDYDFHYLDTDIVDGVIKEINRAGFSTSLKRKYWSHSGSCYSQLLKIYHPSCRYTPPKNFLKRLLWNLRGCPAHS